MNKLIETVCQCAFQDFSSTNILYKNKLMQPTLFLTTYDSTYTSAPVLTEIKSIYDKESIELLSGLICTNDIIKFKQVVLQLKRDYGKIDIGDIRFPDCNYSALHLAVINNCYEMVSLMLSLNCDKNALDVLGRSPLDLAYEYHNSEIISLILGEPAELHSNSVDERLYTDVEAATPDEKTSVTVDQIISAADDTAIDASAATSSSIEPRILINNDANETTDGVDSPETSHFLTPCATHDRNVSIDSINMSNSTECTSFTTLYNKNVAAAILAYMKDDNEASITNDDEEDVDAGDDNCVIEDTEVEGCTYDEFSYQSDDDASGRVLVTASSYDALTECAKKVNVPIVIPNATNAIPESNENTKSKDIASSKVKLEQYKNDIV